MVTKITDKNITNTGVTAGTYTNATVVVNAQGQITSASSSGSGGPKITSIAVTDSSYNNLDDTAVDIAGGYIKITGTGFATGCQVLINNTPATSTTFVSATEVRAQVPATAAGSYIVYLVNTDGGVAIRVNGITFSATPTWVTGSALTGNADEAISIQLSATGATSYVLAQGSTLPTGLTLTSGGLLSGTVTGLVNDTSYSFTINAIDAELQDSPRSFTITISTNLQVARSLRFNSADTTYLSRTFGSAGNRKLWTLNAWYKRSNLTDTVNGLFQYGPDGNNQFRLHLDSAGTITIMDRISATYITSMVTTGLFRDPGAWYHIVLAYDTAQSTAADRVKLYINGTQVTSFSTPTYPSQNADSNVCSASSAFIGRGDTTSVYYYSGLITEMYLIDGLALTPTSFARADAATGQWIPKRYTGTYGTNGFYLNFGDTSNLTATALGKDSSGNNNNFTPNNFRLSQSNVYWSRYFTYGNGSGIVPNLRIFDGTTTTSGANINGVTQNFVPPTPISYNSLEVLFGNGNNTGSAGAPLSLNGVVVQNAPAASGGATSTYTTNIPGVLTTLSVGGGIGNQYESNIYKIKVDGRYLTDPTFSSSLIDSPTNYGTDTGVGGEVRGNYCTLNPAIPPKNSGTASRTIANGNLDLSGASGGWTVAGGTFRIFSGSGRWYYETTGGVAGNTVVGFHKLARGYFLDALLGYTDGADTEGYGYGTDGNKLNNGVSAYGASWTTTDVIGCAIDASGATTSITFYKNGVSQGVAFSNLTGDFIPAVSLGGAGPVVCNFGQRAFAYAAPSGFKAMNTHNIATPNVAISNTAFDTVLYTGTGSALTVGGLSFSPDFVWYKSRSSATYFHGLFDTVRGATKFLATNDSGTEVTDAARLSAFTSDGFTVGTDVGVNTNGANMVAWAWDAGTTTVVNTAGTIQSNIRVNTTAGFSIVSYTGIQATATVGHGLGVAPKLIIAKSRSVSGTNWVVYHSSLGSTSSLLILNLANATTTITNYWGSAVPTSTVFGVANGVYDNNNGSVIAYCFAEVPGYSSFSGWIGNGSADGPFIYTGFRPALIIAKQTNTSGQNWYILDSDRSPSNVVNRRLYPNLTNGEDSDGNINCDLLSNGFKLRDAYTGWNASGGTYVYMAFAEQPFKYARAR